MKPTPLTEADLDAIEAEAKTNAAETYRGALLALVDGVRRLRRVVLDGAQPGARSRGDRLGDRRAQSMPAD